MTLVFTNGCFELIHPGHVDFLARARALGDRLVVEVNSDASVRAIRGRGRPLVPQEDRVAVLQGLRSVDDVVSAAEAIVTSMRNGGRIVLCGDRGSAVDAEYIAAGLAGRFNTERQPAPINAVAVSGAAISAGDNHEAGDRVFARQLEGRAAVTAGAPP